MAVADFYGVAAETITQQVDTITISSVTPAALSRTGIVSYPSAEVAGASPTAEVIKVFDSTTATALVLGTDYTLTASGDGPTRTYTVSRVSTSSNSANGNTCTVTYKWGTAATTLDNMGVAGTAPTGTAFKAAVTDTEGTGVSGLGAASPGGSLTDPAAGKQSSSETGAPGSEYKATPVAPSQYGWPSGVPDTESVYGGGLPSSFAPVDTSFGAANGSKQIDTTIGGGAVRTDGTPPVYRAPTSGVAAGSKDTTLTDILGNQINAPTVPSQASYSATNVDTGYFGAPAQPSALKTQVDTVTSGQLTTPYYLSQAGVIPSTIVVKDTTTPSTLVLNTAYTVTTVGNGVNTVSFINLLAAGGFTVGDNVSITYSWGDSQYWDSNTPAAPPGAPTVGASTSQTDNIATFNATPAALSKTGIVTPPNLLVLKDITNGKTLVQNVDYNVTVSGTGSTLTYSVVRLAGSTNSSLNDNVTVTYRFGNAAWFTSGPVVPLNRGVLVPFTQPAGLTAIDYFLAQSSPDLGTKYVPIAGQAMFSGQPAGAGAEAGAPFFQSDTFTAFPNAALAAPVAPTLGTATSGGTILAGTYKVIVTYVNAFGESVGSPSASQVTTGSTSTITITSPTQPGGATGWYAYVTQVGGSTYTRQQAGAATNIGTNLTLTAPPTSTGANPPAFNGTLPTLSKPGVTVTPQQLVVRDTSRVGNDPMQPGGNVLEYGYDYTVLQFGNGPALVYQIQRLTGSVNSLATDTIVVDYFYDPMGTANLTYVADAVTLSSGSVTLSHTGIVTPAASLIVFDTTVSKPLAQGLDFTVSQVGTGPVTNYKITRISGGPANVGASDNITVYYAFGVVLGTVFNQGLTENFVPIYKPDGTTYSFQGYQFQVAAGNRAGLSNYSNLSDFVVPLNYAAPQPGAQGTTTTITALDPANTINPIYLPDGTVKAGTGLGG